MKKGERGVCKAYDSDDGGGLDKAVGLGETSEEVHSDTRNTHWK